MKSYLNFKTAIWLFWPILILAGLGIYRLSSGEKYGAGKILYKKYCSSCHMEDGTGLRAIIPPLAKADFVQNSGAEMACLIKYGMQGEIEVNGVVFDRPMYGQASIKEVEIRNIINYVKNAWGNEGGELTFLELKDALKSCEGQVEVPAP